MSQAGDTIKRARTRSGVSQRELARRAGTSQAAISRIERGLEEPTVERLEQILAGLGWRPVVELVPIAGHDADPRRLLEDREAEIVARLESAVNWAETANELAGAAAHSSDG